MAAALTVLAVLLAAGTLRASPCGKDCPDPRASALAVRVGVTEPFATSSESAHPASRRRASTQTTPPATRVRAASPRIPLLPPPLPPLPTPAPDPFASPLALDPPIIAWAANLIDPAVPAAERFERLLAALRDPAAIGFREQTAPTLTALEAFHQRRINCVSFAFLLVGLARSLDLPAYFVLIPEILASQSSGVLDIEEQHLAAAVALDGRERIVDFGGDVDPAELAAVPVPDLTAIALFHSNRGVEALAGGDLPGALDELRWATTLDPTIAVVWVNLGVALRRQGESAAAERAYQTALALDPGTRAARVNLQNLLVSQGQADRAADILLATSRAGNRPDPLAILELAEASLRRGDLAAARAHYQRALELSR